MTNKQRAERKLKRAIVARRIVLCFIPASIVFFVIGGIRDSYSFIGAGVGLLITGSVIIFLICGMIMRLREHVEEYCPKCDTASVVLVNTTKRNTGEFQKTVTIAGMLYKDELIHETKYYECKNCGHKMQVISTHTNE